MGMNLRQFYDLYKENRGAFLFVNDFSNTDLEGAALAFTMFMGCSFKGANLKNADFLLAGLIDVDLSFANLEGARLVSVDLSGSLLLGANLKGVLFSDNTIWPIGFDPTKAGGILENKVPNSYPDTIANFLGQPNGWYPKSYKDW